MPKKFCIKVPKKGFSSHNYFIQIIKYQESSPPLTNHYVISQKNASFRTLYVFLHFLSWYLDEIESEGELVELVNERPDEEDDREEAVDEDDLLVEVSVGDRGSKS